MLKEEGLEVVDYGVDNPESVDYPDYGIKVANAVSKGMCRERDFVLRYRHRHVNRSE